MRRWVEPGSDRRQHAVSHDVVPVKAHRRSQARRNPTRERLGEMDERQASREAAEDVRYERWEALLFKHVPGLTRGKNPAWRSDLMMEADGGPIFMKFMSDGGVDDTPNGLALRAWLRARKIPFRQYGLKEDPGQVRVFTLSRRAFARVEAILRGLERRAAR